MAGRGRGATLPAWMTSGSAQVQALAAAVPMAAPVAAVAMPDPRQFDSRDVRSTGDSQSSRDHRSRDDGKARDRDRADRDRGDRDRSERDRTDRDRGDRDRRKRSRSRSRSADRRRGGDREKKEESSGGGWKPRKGKVSNFDVRAPNGIDLPPISINSAAQGLASSQYTASNFAPAAVPSTDATAALTRIDTSMHTRHARRIYAGGIPPSVTEPEIVAFFNEIVTRLLLPQRCSGPPCLKSYINVEKCYAFVEFMSIELATACMQLDGIRFDHHTGATVLRVRRPNDYRPELIPPSGAVPELNQELLAAMGATSSTVGKLFVGGLPYHLNDDQVVELLGAFGPVKSFHQVREPGSNMSKGYAFAEYMRIEDADVAIKGLNGMQLGDKTLTVRFAVHSAQTPSSSQQAMGITMGGGMGALGMGGMGMGGGQLLLANAPFVPAAAPAVHALANVTPTRVLKLCNMLTEEDLYNDAEYEDIREDVRLECSDYGQVRTLLIPRQRDGYPKQAEGLIFAEFADAGSARNAAMALHNRKFADKTVVVTYYEEEKFAARMLC